jgi:hypothetical protein
MMMLRQLRQLRRVVPTAPFAPRSARFSNVIDCERYVPQPILERAELVHRRRASSPSFHCPSPDFHDDSGSITEPLLRTDELCECASNIKIVTGVPEEILELFYLATPVSIENVGAAEFKRWWRSGSTHRPSETNAGQGLYMCMLENCSQREHWERAILSWRNVRSGRDCFIPGMPRYNIPNTYSNAIEMRTARLWRSFTDYPCPIDSQILRQIENDGLDNSIDMHPLGWVLRPIELQIFGHFPKVMQPQLAVGSGCDSASWYLKEILLSPDTSPARQHLIRFHHWWNDESNANALDELYKLNKSWREEIGGRTLRYSNEADPVETVLNTGLCAVSGIGLVFRGSLVSNGVADDASSLAR